MKYSLATAALFAAVTTVTADLCAKGSVDVNGNWYCQEVTAITYTGVGGAGFYNKINNMDSNDGLCTSSAQSYSGTLAPLDEEVSLHFRGPMNLKQVAVYTPSAPSNKVRRSTRHRHGHAHAHGHSHVAREEPAPVEERQLGAMVFAEIDGKPVSWVNEYSGESTSAPAAAAATSWVTATIDGQVVSWQNSVAGASTSAPAAAAATSSPAAGVGLDIDIGVSVGIGAAASSSSSSSAGAAASSASSSGSWGRQAYYDSSSATADGLVFLNHQGGSGSGVFDTQFGNSLSYASTNGAQGAASPQILADTTLASSTEVVIMTNQQCSGSDCGYSRPGTVAYHGFDGPSKAFFFEFGMPSDGQTTASQWSAVNMPAIWMLNAQIPRTLQYGSALCSCWTSGCGEFDIFEVLAPGDARAKSTLHGNIAGGDSDYFARPLTGTIKAAVVLFNNNIHIKILDNNTVFGETVAQSLIDEIAQQTSTQADAGVSLFALSG